MRVAVTQPNFLPWLGYFALLDEVDLWVSLDNVQCVRRSFIVRNRVKGEDDVVRWLTVSLAGAPRATQINQSRLCRSPWWDALANRLEAYYRRSTYFADYYSGLRRLLAPRASDKVLSIYNRRVVLELCEILGVSVEVVDASSLVPQLRGSAQDKILALCREAGATALCSFQRGVEVGLYDGGQFAKHGIALHMQRYQHPAYTQLGQTFIPYLSTIDLIFNVGPNSLDVLRKGSNWVSTG